MRLIRGTITILQQAVLVATVLSGLVVTNVNAQEVPPIQTSNTEVPVHSSVPENPPGAFFASIANAAKSLQSKANQNLSSGLLEAGRKIATTSMITWALGAAGSLAMVYWIFMTIQALGQDRPMAHVIFEVGLPVVICAYLLQNYDLLISEFAGSSGFLSYIRNVGGDPVGGVIEMYSKVLQMVALAIGTACQDLTDTFSVFTIKASLLALFDAAMAVLFALVILGLCLSGTVEMLGLILLGPFLGAVAIAVGPIFIAGLVTPWTRDYFGKWLGFLVGSAVLTGVLGICISIASALFATFNFYEIAGTSAPSAMALLIVAIVIMTVNALIQQAPAIASALVPGSLGASKGVANSIRKGAGDVHSRAYGTALQARDMMRRPEKNKATPNVKEAWRD